MDYTNRHKYLRRKILEGKRAAEELQRLVQQQFEESMEKLNKCQDNATED